MIAIVVLQTGDSVVLPKVLEVVVYLVIQAGWQWVVVAEPAEHGSPLVEFEREAVCRRFGLR